MKHKGCAELLNLSITLRAYPRVWQLEGSWVGSGLKPQTLDLVGKAAKEKHSSLLDSFISHEKM